MNTDNFVTPLGTIELNIEFKSDILSNDLFSKTSQMIQTANLSIEISAFDDITRWVKESLYPVEASKGWIIRVTKRTEIEEQLIISCELTTEARDVIAQPDSGEHLDALWIENETHFLSIGTEDGERMKWRAERNDYLPTRFAKQLGYQSDQYSFTEYLDLGFKTIIPDLRKDEQLYFHYLVAVNPRKKSIEFPDENDVSTHFAVDFPKWTLLEKLGIRE